MARFSTGLRNAMAGEWGLGIMMQGGVIRVYSGTRPATPDSPPGATLLGAITQGGRYFIPGSDPNAAGLLLRTTSPGILLNDGEWRLRGVMTGVAAWWRWSWADPDNDAYSEYYPRVDGAIPGELVLATTAITAATNVLIEEFVFSLGLGS